MKILLFRGKGFISWAIKFQTRSQYSHAAILFSDDVLIEATSPKVRKLEVDGPIAGDYDAFDVPVITKENEDSVRAFCEKQVGKPYDYTMVVRFVTRQQETRKSKGAWFCSELVFAALMQAGVVLLRNIDPWAVSPQLLSISPMLVETPGTFNPPPPT